VRVSISGEMLEVDEMGIWGMHLEAARRAMNRLKEQNIFTLFKDTALPVFDNVQAWGPGFLTTPDLGTINNGIPYQKKFATSGRGADGKLNGTLHIFDLIDTMSALLVRNYTPTDMLINPIGWAILARNPILNGFHVYGGQIQQNPRDLSMYKARSPQDMQSMLQLPWALNLHISKFVPIETDTTGSAPYVTDIYLGARQNGLMLLEGRPLAQDAYTDFVREVYNIRLKEYYGLGIADAGRSWVALKNIRIDNSFEFFTTKMVG
jgi:hypothetical protein